VRRDTVLHAYYLLPASRCSIPPVSERAFFIVNPSSAGGNTGREWESTLRARALAAFPLLRWALTSKRGDGADLAARAVSEGADLVVAVGGDGTVNEVVNGLMGVRIAGGDPAGTLRIEGHAWPSHPAGRPVLGMLPRGTGCDFVKSLAIPKDAAGAFEVLAGGGDDVDADLCEIEFGTPEDVRCRRYSMNQCGCGATGEVASRVNRAGRPQHGFLAFLVASLHAAAAYRPRAVEIAVGGELPRRVMLKALFVCNGQYCGGGMRIGRGAIVNDGVMRLYTGRVEGVAGVRVYNATTLRVTSEQAVLADCDGEQPGVLPATYTVRPGALAIRVGRGATAVRSRAHRASQTTSPFPEGRRLTS
jgi:diacylglycerol kinase family enzyme